MTDTLEEQNNKHSTKATTMVQVEHQNESRSAHRINRSDSPLESNDTNDKKITKTKLVHPHNHNSNLISTSSPGGLMAATMVTPERISSLLIRKGPLAIRYITNELNEDIPCFKNLSSSKKRRLIMNVMEKGDKKNCIIFEKIGWGQWSAKRIDSIDHFETERDLTNLNNLKIKDLISSHNHTTQSQQQKQINKKKRRRNTTTTADSTTDSLVNTNIKERKLSLPEVLKYPNIITSTNENVLVSDSDEIDSDNEEEEPFHYNNKPSSIPSSPKRISISCDIKKKTTTDNTQLFLKNLKAQQKIKCARSRKNSSFSITNSYSKNRSNSISSYYLPELKSLSSALYHNINNTSNCGSISEPNSRRSSLFSNHNTSNNNESSIRSTLSPPQYKLISTPPILNEKIFNITYNYNQNHSETDEEDWASLGAQSLREKKNHNTTTTITNNNNNTNNIIPIMKLNDSYIINDNNIITLLPPEAITYGVSSVDDKNVASLLMNLK
ncbi:Stb3p NDAI_0J00750 [Naumovozyma dairenensis CBS 421]|uniref:Uncharacterized protein n=1 Tax=Naumovozyma dairenensis (strain ATCC 10597 / BCRC 20456 / CBS 421 / NBRC 0211 / NRRL Y-12639) TaxID=1071378 RepID=G0WGN9_NAUDC|nr:hypothetical protein NDAI_0J00750 [Naumovozyma dairenensis CBS 421]CCD26967.1 hypothetical protein NDAI_0J00750 [Naumovozyma dairenensis CBS 421]